jgi:putative flavoprotein involved in K+ transport
MPHIPCVVIGAGQAGLAISRCLADRGIQHVVLERGRVAERWRSERWESLRLLTPNWQSRLPGFSYDGPDPDGYMTMPEVVAYLERYAASFDAPIRSGVDVEAVTREGRGYLVRTSAGDWRTRAVVIATGYACTPAIPAMASRLPADIVQTVPTEYRNASRLPEGGVLVVGASASGVQLADEIHRSGRPVTVAVGQHTRLPRRYRGRDILWWLDRMGVLDETIDQVYDVEISRDQPSLQLVGHPEHTTIDLAGLRDRGVRVVGRLIGVDGDDLHFADDLVATTAAADFKLASVLSRIDAYIERTGMAAEPGAPFVPHCLGFVDAETSLSLAEAGIRTVVWATGFTREYPWLRVPVLDRRGEIRHTGGLTAEPGLYVIGMHFLRRRKSSFIDGVGDDAKALAAHIGGFLTSGSEAVA